MAEGGIEAQEKRGQTKFVNAEILPRKMDGNKHKLEKMGIKFLDNYDELFVNVELPEGWEKKPTDHSMWSDLLDDKGRKRGSIFYKAAFYDMDAFIHLARRYNVTWDYDNHYAKVMDLDTELFKTESAGDRDWDKQDLLKAKAKKWVDEKFPDWEDETAYWEE